MIHAGREGGGGEYEGKGKGRDTHRQKTGEGERQIIDDRTDSTGIKAAQLQFMYLSSIGMETLPPHLYLVGL